MTFCKFHGAVAVRTFCLEINIPSVIIGDLFVAVTSIMIPNVI